MEIVQSQCFDPKTEILSEPQQIWPLALPPGAVLRAHGGTAVALHLGYRRSVDFYLLWSERLDKKERIASFKFMRDAQTIQEDEKTDHPGDRLALDFIELGGRPQRPVTKMDGVRSMMRSS